MAFEKQAALVRRLYERTVSGDLDWKLSPVGEETFQISFPNYTVIIYVEGSDVFVGVLNETGHVADQFSDVDLKGMKDPPVGGGWFTTMKELHAKARRTALGADKALDSILEELE